MTNTAEGARGTSANATIALFSLSLSPRDVYNMRSTDERRPSAPTQSGAAVQVARCIIDSLEEVLILSVLLRMDAKQVRQPVLDRN